MTVMLAALLAVLSGAAVLGSVRQAAIARQTADTHEETRSYEEAAYLSLQEMALIQGSLNEPDGEERLELLSTDAQVSAAINLASQSQAEHEAHDEHAAAMRDIAQRQQTLRPAIEDYLQHLDHDDHSAALDTVEDDIEPTIDLVHSALAELKAEHLAEQHLEQAEAQGASRLLMWGSILIFLLGMLTLALFIWSSRRHQRQVEAMATTDALTGLPNRTAFTSHTSDHLAHRRMVTVLTVNLDGFRQVNDQLGTAIGDRLLIEAGQRLATAVRRDDIVARLGGDEFAVLLLDSDPQIAAATAARLTGAFHEPFVLGDVTVDLEVSIGAATSEPGEDAAAVLVHADLAMHTAKTQRLGFQQFAPSHRYDTAARLDLLGDLRRALDTGDQLTLHYQPKIAVDTGAIAGVEALARWQHPTKGAISPGEFIPVLETTSLIHQFTDRVLTIALAQARTWRDAGHPIPVSVNISTRTLLDGGFTDRVATLLTDFGVPGDQLCIEITEYTLMADPATAIAALQSIRQLGVKTSIDDYGTGYSSMAYLRTLPIDELKIDRSFVRDMTTDPGNYALVTSTVDLGHNLGLTVTAEGVEDDQTRAALTAAGCDHAQGYHFDRPMPANQLTQRLQQQTTLVSP
jgi:diguanylate cyclase (GGDEF)-like protein